MKFGASSWPFQWEPPYDTAIRRIAKLGFKAIELIGWNKDFLKDYYVPATIQELKKVLKGEGIALSQFVSTPHGLSHPDKKERDAAVEHWKRAVAVGTELGSPIINMVSCYPFAIRDPDVPLIKKNPLVQT
jgi:sugar phosphate isomerase/epimerase